VKVLHPIHQLNHPWNHPRRRSSNKAKIRARDAELKLWRQLLLVVRHKHWWTVSEIEEITFEPLANIRASLEELCALKLVEEMSCVNAEGHCEKRYRCTEPEANDTELSQMRAQYLETYGDDVHYVCSALMHLRLAASEAA
jgi:hypothetical protein